MSNLKQAIFPLSIILLALSIRFFVYLPVIEIKGQYLSTNEVIANNEAIKKAVNDEFLLRADGQADLIAAFNLFDKATTGDVAVLKQAFVVASRIADLVIVITVFFVLPAVLRRKT
jgi:hypothetical protein